MGSRLFVVAALGSAVATPVWAQKGPPPGPPAPKSPPPGPPTPAADLEKQGLDLYKAGDYAGSVEPLTKAQELEPNRFEYRFALAQALRQAGRCADAVPHYKALVDNAPDPATARDVRSAMEQCPNTQVEAPPTPPPPPAPPPAPVSHGGGIDGGDALMLAGAGAGIAAGVSLFIAARWSHDDANAAALVSAHDSIEARATVMDISAIVCAGVGVALGVASIVRIKHHSETTDVAIVPRADGGAFVVRGSW